MRSSELAPQELRGWTLFFDRIVWPASRAIHIASGPSEQFLEQAGVLTRPEYTFYGHGGPIIAQMQVAAFRDLEAKEPGRWALALGENALQVHGGNLVPEKGISLELVNALPVPDKDVPLNEILEFRLRRAGELEALRSELDSIAATIGRSPDNASELDTRIRVLDETCANLLKVGREWQFPMRLTSKELSIEFSPNLPAFSAFAAQGLGLTATSTVLATAAAGLASSIKFKAVPGWKGLKRDLGPYGYVYRYHKEVF